MQLFPYDDLGVGDAVVVVRKDAPDRSFVIPEELFIEKSPDSAIIKKSLSCPNELHIIEEIGRGGFGCVSKAIWRGSIVAAKEVPTAGNAKVLENELAVYRSLNHPNLLSLLGTMQRPQSLVLIMNYVRGQSLHNVIFGDGPQV
jgi:serine/threonine protein kinase